MRQMGHSTGHTSKETRQRSTWRAPTGHRCSLLAATIRLRLPRTSAIFRASQAKTARPGGGERCRLAVPPRFAAPSRIAASPTRRSAECSPITGAIRHRLPRGDDAARDAALRPSSPAVTGRLSTIRGSLGRSHRVLSSSPPLRRSIVTPSAYTRDPILSSLDVSGHRPRQARERNTADSSSRLHGHRLGSCGTFIPAAATCARSCPLPGNDNEPQDSDYPVLVWYRRTFLLTVRSRATAPIPLCAGNTQL